MRRRVFEKKIVYYLAVAVSIILTIISVFSAFSLFYNFNVITLLMTCLSIIFSLFAFVHLIEKYDKAVLFLNLSIAISALDFLSYILLRISERGFNGISGYLYFKAFIAAIVIILVVNKYKVRKSEASNEIEEIGKNTKE